MAAADDRPHRRDRGRQVRGAGGLRAARRGDDLQRRGRPRAARLRAAARAGWPSAGGRTWRRRAASTAPGSARSSSPTPRSSPGWRRRSTRWSASGSAPGSARCRPTTEVAVVEVPLLFESGMDGVFDTTVAVVTADEVRASRAEARGHALVGEREARQLAQDEKARARRARDRERRHARGARAALSALHREAEGMRGARRTARGAGRRRARRRRRGAAGRRRVLLGVVGGASTRRSRS